MSNYDDIRREVLDSTRGLAEHGYLGRLSSGGNISVRVPGEKIVVITPSGKSYFSLDLNDICVIDFDHNSIEGSLSPSIEAGMHIGVYKNRRDVNAVIHTHQPFASVLAIINKPIPALFDEIAVEIDYFADMHEKFFANLSCPNCFSAQVTLCEEETEGDAASWLLLR